MITLALNQRQQPEPNQAENAQKAGRRDIIGEKPTIASQEKNGKKNKIGPAKTSQINVSANHSSSKATKVADSPLDKVFPDLSQIPLFEDGSRNEIHLQNIVNEEEEHNVQGQSHNLTSELCAEVERMDEVNENEEELFQDLETVGEDIGETSFQDVESLFDSFL